MSKRNIYMKNMLIAAAVAGSAVAGMILLGRKKLKNRKQPHKLNGSPVYPERSALQTMG